VGYPPFDPIAGDPRFQALPVAPRPAAPEGCQRIMPDALAPPPPPRSLTERLGGLALRLLGWSVVGVRPTAPRFVITVAPHTSNWDFFVGLASGYGAGILSRWPYGFFAKSAVFLGPMGWALRALGGIPIDRSAPHDAVLRSAELLRQRERYLLVITPEGTRRRTERWHAGFYHIARQAGVPVVPVAFDYGRRECRIGPATEMSGDPDADLEVFRRFYAGVTARYPERFGPIRFQDQPVAEVLSRHSGRLLAIPGVTGTAEGRCGGQPCILVLVVRRTPELADLIPDELEGIPVEIRETGPIHALDPG
jgi:1-acyl-sn-glycerol-3-phosphate acyltransferase